MRKVSDIRQPAVLLLTLLLSIGSLAQNLTEVSDFGMNAGNLRMFMHIPPGTDKRQRKQLVLVLHGCTQSAGIISAQTGWNKLADEYGFLVVYPQQKLINNAGKCFCWYRRGDITKGKGEDASIMEMVDYMKRNYSIDSSHVFITGLSAGAMMSVAMMATNPEVFNAGAIFAGGPYKSALNVFSGYLVGAGWVHKTPAKWAYKIRKQNEGYTGPYPRMIIYQGRNDIVVNRRNGFELVKQWTYIHHVDTVPSDKINCFALNKDIEKDVFRDDRGIPRVTYYKINHLGHAYLINPGKCINEGGKRGLFSRDKNFHATWWTALDFGMIPEKSIQGKTKVEVQEEKLVYSVTPVPDASYNWSFPADCIVVSGAGTHSVTLNWGKTNGNVNLQVTSPDGCKIQYPSIAVRQNITK
ncbi:MAG TPA: PHB depolymerase family esterase [Bacteroidia bacterium]|jgi:poly(hydroxyalkanoate) depolymerase family esterase|nr:PHB depolymerase family esterase [Bacteroidia bacterium]